MYCKEKNNNTQKAANCVKYAIIIVKFTIIIVKYTNFMSYIQTLCQNTTTIVKKKLLFLPKTLLTVDKRNCNELNFTPEVQLKCFLLSKSLNSLLG